MHLPERAVQVWYDSEGHEFWASGTLIAPYASSIKKENSFPRSYIYLEASGKRGTCCNGREREPNPPVLSRLRQWAFFVFLILWFSKTANFWISKLTC